MPSAPFIIFFDGHCNLCNGFVDFIVRRNGDGTFQLASLQGQTAKKLLDEKDRQKLSSVVLRFDDGRVLYKSKAVFKIFREIGGGWSMLCAFAVLPTRWTDAIYDLVAHYRYSLFGRNDTCRLPTPAESAYFLD